MTARYGHRTAVGQQVSEWSQNRRLLGLSYQNPIINNPSRVTVTADTNANTYGAWTEIVASLSADTSVLVIGVGGIAASTVATASVISFGIGASGSEVELFYYAVGSANVAITNGVQDLNITIPVQLPAGTRIAARLQSVITLGKTCTVGLQSFAADPATFIYQPTKYDALGVNLSTSEGVSLPASSVYAEIVAATTIPYRGVVLVPSASAGTMQGNMGQMTVAVGPSGSEVDFGTINYTSQTVEGIYAINNAFIPRNIPVGSRIAVKQNVNNTTIDASLIGVI